MKKSFLYAAICQEAYSTDIFEVPDEDIYFLYLHKLNYST